MTLDVRRVLVVQHEDDSGLGRFAEPLARGFGPVTVDLDVVRPAVGDLLPEDAYAAGYAGVVVLGGSMAAWEDDLAPWLPATRRLIARAVETLTPILGICLGAQLLALATGGTVLRGDADLEVGLVEVTFTADAATDRLLGPVLSALGQRAVVAHWHQDAITALPPSAVLLATGPLYRNQAFRVGEAAWGLQYHPEVCGADFSRWARDGGEAVLHAGGDPEKVRDEVAEAEEELSQLAFLHARSFAAIVTT